MSTRDILPNQGLKIMILYILAFKQKHLFTKCLYDCYLILNTYYIYKKIGVFEIEFWRFYRFQINSMKKTAKVEDIKNINGYYNLIFTKI